MGEMNVKAYIGIDPGANGALAVIESDGHCELILCNYMTYDWWLDDLKRRYDGNVSCVVEDVHAMPMNGCKGNFMLGWSLGKIQHMLDAKRIPYQLVKPQTWQREYGISNKDKSKSQSVETAKRLFPHVDLRRTEKCTKDHDGYADALLMAEYARRRMA